MRVLVTGAKGQLGHDVLVALQKDGHIGIGVDIDEMDITKAEDVKRVIAEAKVDAVIHCAAYTAVDAAEDSKELCFRVNADGTRHIAEVCKDLDMKMIYISTDYVFDGEGVKAWEPDDERHPLNVYGKSKYLGELAVEELLNNYFIVRISWAFGENGNNFVKTMLKLAETRDELNVVDDQIGSPTYTADLAKLLIEMVESEQYGVYHVTNESLCSWYEFAVEIFRQTNREIKVNPVSSEIFPTKAKRPHNSRMNKEKLIENGFSLLPSWQDALGRYLAIITKDY